MIILFDAENMQILHLKISNGFRSLQWQWKPPALWMLNRNMLLMFDNDHEFSWLKIPALCKEKNQNPVPERRHRNILNRKFQNSSNEPNRLFAFAFINIYKLCRVFGHWQSSTRHLCRKDCTNPQKRLCKYSENRLTVDWFFEHWR